MGRWVTMFWVKRVGGRVIWLIGYTWPPGRVKWVNWGRVNCWGCMWGNPVSLLRWAGKGRCMAGHGTR